MGERALDIGNLITGTQAGPTEVQIWEESNMRTVEPTGPEADLCGAQEI